ncbi:putative bifunctional diguanylate cyclase/phosphodiesterase [Sulfurimonas autotrophica]|uniref:Diguanylate cyclase/phosphodiesterase n=1 Tax=Sulfurimonas autotrophica (strain ATCC BAA-671 / DSM 16294 / JCM 11897 / OK10) TaxID=563040 RepID=E0URN8_SULAO|nr:EAL domain-containing protein [Sulfurimonas autotrophica]ADN08982.1 diguanylate cyclase/phosphodiesterase [Sulfurimonas autotrophica DSM 16294]
MNSISIKSFIISTMFVAFLLEAYIFYNFFENSKASISKLLQTSIQTDILNLKHYMEKNLKLKDINEIASHIDNIIIINPTIKDIHILNNNKNLIYHPKLRYNGHTHQAQKCLPISAITAANIFKQQCYSFSIKTFHKLRTKYYYANVYIDETYINGLITKQIEKTLITFLITALIFSIFLWILFRAYIIIPLEKLHQYAYYSENPPRNFFIKEIESIRFSLSMTFKRLKQEQEELYNLSTKDPLSGLYNRLSLVEKLNWLISKGKRDKNEFAMIFLDLDNFKNINDSKGHEFGDKILKYISDILLNATRNNDIVSRLGGDEFVVVLPDYKDENKIVEIAQRLKEKLSTPFKIDNEDYQITASMGIAIYPKDGDNVQTLLKNADIAMYKSKELGKNNFQFFTDAINKAVQEKISMQRIIKDALSQNHFKLFYQPKVDIKTNKIVGCEALIRLIDPIEGLIPPYQFISIAEENLSIIPLGEWIIQEAASQIKKWEHTPLRNIKVSINLSGVQFKDPYLLQKLQTYTQEIDRSKFDIELTESVLIDNFNKRLDIIKGIKELGISLSLDDFGTGYSSLSYLKDIPFDTLKIDKSFIDNLYTKDDLTFVNMIIGIAEDLALNVVAEGVETEEQLKLLKEINCELYQGYLCSKPVVPKEFEELFILN